MGEMLSVKNINVFYGSIQALRDISFHVNEGEIVTLIGANGAGKTTTMHAISGLLKVQSGEIDYCGQNISKMEAHKIPTVPWYRLCLRPLLFLPSLRVYPHRFP